MTNSTYDKLFRTMHPVANTPKSELREALIDAAIIGGRVCFYSGDYSSPPKSTPRSFMVILRGDDTMKKKFGFMDPIPLGVRFEYYNRWLSPKEALEFIEEYTS